VQDRNVPLPTTQWSTHIIGRLYIHVASSMKSPDLIAAWDWWNATNARNKLVQIWPPLAKDSMILWPLPSFGDADAQQSGDICTHVPGTFELQPFRNRTMV